MKKLFLIIAISALVAVSFIACDDDFKDIYIIEEQADSNNKKTAPGSDNQQVVPSTNENIISEQNTSFIGEEKAKSIAMERAGVSENEVVFERTELEKDNGIWQYEIEFKKGRTEYDADIKADDGTMLSFDVDYDD